MNPLQPRDLARTIPPFFAHLTKGIKIEPKTLNCPYFGRFIPDDVLKRESSRTIMFVQNAEARKILRTDSERPKLERFSVICAVIVVTVFIGIILGYQSNSQFFQST